MIFISPQREKRCTEFSDFWYKTKKSPPFEQNDRGAAAGFRPEDMASFYETGSIVPIL